MAEWGHCDNCGKYHNREEGLHVCKLPLPEPQGDTISCREAGERILGILLLPVLLPAIIAFVAGVIFIAFGCVELFAQNAPPLVKLLVGFAPLGILGWFCGWLEERVGKWTYIVPFMVTVFGGLILFQWSKSRSQGPVKSVVSRVSGPSVPGASSVPLAERKDPMHSATSNASSAAVMENPAGEWVGFQNAPNKDRENELRGHVGNFRRITAQGDFRDLCRSIRKQCAEVRAWDGQRFPCDAVSRLGHDGSRVAFCQSSPMSVAP